MPVYRSLYQGFGVGPRARSHGLMLFLVPYGSLAFG